MGKTKKNSKEELVKTVVLQLNDDPGGLILQSLQGDSAKSLGEAANDAVLGAPEGIGDPTQVYDSPVKTKLTKLMPDGTAVSPANSEKTVVVGSQNQDSNPSPSEGAEQNAKTIVGRVSTPSEATMVVGRSISKTENVAFGVAKVTTRAPSSEHAAAVEAQIHVSDSLRLAQNRILEIESELEKLRAENESLASQNQQSAERLHDYETQVESLEKQKNEVLDQFSGELSVLRESLHEKEKYVIKLQQKVEELEARVGKDLRKIRVRERELENRLEIAKVEREALLRAKDETLLEQQRRLQDSQAEVDGLRARIAELNKQLDSNNEQFSRTVRALRLALTNLEGGEANLSPIPLKKAE